MKNQFIKIDNHIINTKDISSIVYDKQDSTIVVYFLSDQEETVVPGQSQSEFDKIWLRISEA